MQMVERIFEDRIQQQIDIDDMKFGFMKGKGTIDAIFIVRQMGGKAALPKWVWRGLVHINLDSTES